jgi:hypothetical protein
MKISILNVCLLFLLSNCNIKSDKFYLRMQLVKFLNEKRFVILEDTVYFNAINNESAFINGNKIAKEKMIENQRKNIETYYFEIKNLKNENLLKLLDEDIKLKYMILNTNNNNIKKLNLIID